MGKTIADEVRENLKKFREDNKRSSERGAQHVRRIIKERSFGKKRGKRRKR